MKKVIPIAVFMVLIVIALSVPQASARGKHRGGRTTVSILPPPPPFILPFIGARVSIHSPKRHYRHHPQDNRPHRWRSHKRHGHWTCERVWVPGKKTRVWRKGHWKRRGHWVSGHWVVRYRPGHWVKKKVWVSDRRGPRHGHDGPHGHRGRHGRR